MQLHSFRNLRTARTTLRVVKGFKKDNPEVTVLSHTAWLFASSILWNSTAFSTSEIEAGTGKIKEFLQLSREPRKAFLVFCQRIALAPILIGDVSEQSLELPSIWLDRRNKAGFAATKSEYDRIRKVRASLPHYCRDLKALAEAVLEFSEEPTGKNYRYWKSYFADRQARGILEFFQIFSANYLFTL